MAVKAELREFFLRNIQVRNGSMKDREINYPVKHFVNKYFIENGISEIRKIEVGNRFLKGNVPSAEMYEKLFNSIIFKENVEDCATTLKPGIVIMATRAQLTAGLKKDDNGNTLAVGPDLLTSSLASVYYGPTGTGVFALDTLVNYSITTRIINTVIYVKVQINNVPANSNMLSASNTINFSSAGQVYSCPANIIRTEQYIIQFQALQVNKTMKIDIYMLNGLGIGSNTRISIDTGWRPLL